MSLARLRPASSNKQDSVSPSPTTSLGSGYDTMIPSPTSSTDHKCEDCEKILEKLEDPAENPNVPLPGWPELAQLITRHPDLEAFQPFRDLHIKSLLYYQAELDGLRKSLHDTEWDNHRHGDFPQAEYLGKRVDKLLDCKYNKEKEDRRQLELLKEIRQVLKEYSEALLRYKQISALPQADRLNVDSLRVWLRNVHGDNIPISGYGAESWGKITKKVDDPLPLKRQFLRLILSIVWARKDEDSNIDLIVPRYSRKIDGLSQWVANEGVPFWESVRERWKAKKKIVPDCLPLTEKLSTPDPPSNKPKDPDEIKLTLTKYSEHSILVFTSAVATIVACLLPTAAIAVLSKVHGTGKLLGLIAGFTTAFALGLRLLTDVGTSRVQIFTATAAFSAVLVVFVQNQS